MTEMKHLGEKPPVKYYICIGCGIEHPNTKHYRQSLIEAAAELRDKNFNLTDRLALQDWVNELRK